MGLRGLSDMQSTTEADGAGGQLLRICSDDLPARNRTAILRERYGRLIVKHDFEPLANEPLNFCATLRPLPRIGLSSVVSSDVLTRRTARHVENDDLVLNIMLAGLRRFCARGRE